VDIKRTIAGFAAGHARLVERFTRTNRDTLDYRFTVDDPATWTKPWTALVPAERTDVEIYEFACHEGNYGLPNILSAARSEDKQ
jgi:hypothetical protein